MYKLKESYCLNDTLIFLKKINYKITKIFINSVVGNDNMLVNYLFLLNKQVTGITHDFSLLFNKSNPYYEDFNKIKRNNINIDNFNNLICQNIVDFNLYKPFFNKPQNITICELPDYKKEKEKILTNNNKIIIGIIGHIVEIKGLKHLEELNNLINNNLINNNLKDKYKLFVFGSCNLPIEQSPYKNINELNNLLKIHKPNMLLELSISPETYSYTLTLGMIMNLPILSINKLFPSVIFNRLAKYDKVFFYKDINELFFNIKANKQDYFYTIEPKLYFNYFWDNYFKENGLLEHINRNNPYNIKPYAIYFPQFHSMKENDKNYYKDYTDITNLNLIINEKKIYQETPSLKLLPIKNLLDYDLVKNKELIQKQIDLINNYNISGFAIYYYWFSTNTITNKNMIMEQVIDKFFSEEINMKKRKVFFIWANESWSKNVAFGNNLGIIENTYNDDDLFKNINNLIKYFKHNNYLKIDNKPVFFIHHPWFMPLEKLNLFKSLINEKCLENNFDGCHLIINSINGTISNYKHYDHNFNYKNFKNIKNINNQNIIDYSIYLNNLSFNKNIKTLVFNFDNRSRLYKPDRLQNSNITINNDENTYLKFMNTIFGNYSRTTEEIDKILLVNSWNEWGEQMAIEPSNEMGTYYLDLIKRTL